jgi:hypothetical protein
MSLVRRVCSVAAAVGVAAPLLSSVAVANRDGGGDAARAGGLESAPERAALRGPRIAQLGRSSGGSPAPIRPSGSGSSSGVTTSGPPPSPVSPSTSAPASRLGAPAPQAPAIVPLSPQQQSQFATGGSVRSGLALSPGSSSGSPSEQTPSAPGGGGKTLAACMGFWEKATHMTKAEWREACKRTMQDYPSVR